MLLVPNNQSSAGSLLTLESEFIPVWTPDSEEIKQAICPSDDAKSQIKRSVKKLQDSGWLPRQGDAITRCPMNVDQMCLNLKDDEAPSESFSIASSSDADWSTYSMET